LKVAEDSKRAKEVEDELPRADTKEGDPLGGKGDKAPRKGGRDWSCDKVPM